MTLSESKKDISHAGGDKRLAGAISDVAEQKLRHQELFTLSVV